MIGMDRLRRVGIDR